jgi:hypothetical protein
MDTPPAPVPVGPAGLSAIVKPLAPYSCGETHAKADWGRVTYGSGEEPNDERIKKLIDNFYGDMRRSAQKLQDRVEQVLRPWFPAQESRATKKGAAEDLTRAQWNAFADAFEQHFREVAGMKRDQEGFVSPTTGDGIVQDYYLNGLSLGVLRANEATQSGAANVLIARDSNAVQSFINEGFARLSDQGALRLEQIMPQVKQIIQQGISLGDNPLDIAKQLSDRFDQYKGWEFERLARTETAFAQNAGYNAECDAAGVDMSRVDPSAVPAHPNCVLPGTRVIAPDLIAAYEIPYEGLVIEITLASGRRLTVTENHLLLTRNGFIPAKALRKGDDVVYCPDFEGMVLADPDDNGEPPLVDEVVKAFAESSGVSTRTMPVTAEHFHSDGRSIQGNVNVVGADCLLELCGKAARGEHLSADDLATLYTESFKFAGDSALTLGFQRIGLAASGIEGMRGDSYALFLREVGNSHIEALASRADGDSGLSEHPGDGLTANAEGGRNGLLGLSGKVSRSNLRCSDMIGSPPPPTGNALGLAHSAGLDSGVIQDAADVVPTRLELLDDVLEERPGFVAFDNILSVRVVPYSGHVYDLQTLSTLYIAEGVMSSNCLCTYSTQDIDGRLTLIYEVAANACDACLAIKATNPV